MKEEISSILTSLKNELETEIDIITNYTENIAALKQIVRRKEWITLEESMKKAKKIADKINITEELRIASLKKIKEELHIPEKEAFWKVSLILDSKFNCNISGYFQKLKITVIRLKVISKSTFQYLQHNTRLIQDILEEYFPHTKGTFYSHEGKTKQRDTDSIMINAQI